MKKGTRERRIELNQCCKALGRTIGRAIKGAEGGFNIRGAGFCLMLFDFGAGGDMTYISNARRDDMIKAIEEFLEHVKTDDFDALTPTPSA